MEDSLEYIFFCFRALIWWCLATAVLTLVLVFAFRKPNQRPRWIMILPVLIVAATGWFVYFSVNGKQAWAMILLDSEDDRTAEYAYNSLFKVDLKEAANIAANTRHRGNVRFYAAFRAADLLVTNDQRSVESFLQNLKSTSSFQTDFFNTNGLTCGYFVPGHMEGPFDVRELIRRRLQELRNQTNSQKAL